MSTSLVVNDKYSDLPTQIDSLLDKSNIFNQIATRAADPNTTELAQFHTFNDTSLAEIASNMVEINRASKVFGRKNSQITNKLMTLTMLQDASPYRVMRQCIAEIENRRGAIKENLFNLRRDKINLEEMLKRLNTMKIEGIQTHVIAHHIVDIEELASKIEDSMIYVEGSLKDVYSFQSAYDQIKKNNDIPDNWDENDFEAEEIKSHIRFAFLLVYRNSMSLGRMDAGTLEYLHQFGIHPQLAAEDVMIYQNIANTAKHDYEQFEQWLDSMALKYGECYKKVMTRIGLTNLIDQDAVYTDPNKVIIK